MTVQTSFKDRTNLVNELMTKMKQTELILNLPLKADLVIDTSDIDLCDLCFGFVMRRLLTQISTLASTSLKKRNVLFSYENPIHCQIKDMSKIKFQLHFGSFKPETSSSF